jgi:hypothetical protein
MHESSIWTSCLNEALLFPKLLVGHKYMLQTSYLLTFNIPDEGYSRNALCTLNLIFYDFIASLLKTECYNYSSFVNVQSVKR